MLVDVTEEMVRDQLHRVLDSAQFKSSRRCRSFLEYVVEQASGGRLDHLKERTIGIEVFGRDPNYDTNHDPVVRGTASEIRKRLAQYYQELDHADELRINLAAGSYLPEFQVPSRPKPQAIAPAPPVITLVPPEPEFVPVAVPTKRRGWLLPLFGLLAVAAVLISTVLVIAPSLGTASRSRSAVERFWAPVFGDPGAVLLSVGQPTVFNLVGSLHDEVLNHRSLPEGSSKKGGEEKALVDLRQIVPNSDRYLALGDAICLSRLSAFFATHGHAFHVRGGSSTSFADLRENTAVLIGGFTNDWTMRLTKPLRFTFAENQSNYDLYVQDRLHPEQRPWVIANSWPDWKMPLDYAIVTRTLDPNTGKIVITAAGMTQYGTAAAGEFLTDPKYLAQVLRNAPGDWPQKNMEVVLSTRVIGGTAGPPEILATNFQ